MRRALLPAALLGAAAFFAVRSNRRTRARRSVESERGGLGAALARHDEKVARISAHLRARTSTAPLSLKKRAVKHEVPKARDLRRHDERLDISDLDRILHIDVERRLCIAEPGVTFVDLVAATMKRGLIPIIVPEFKTITIGGAVSGCSIESMSFQAGGFHDTCTEYEVITASGDVLTCTPDNEQQLLFQMIHGSFGTLGVLSRLTFRLIPARPFVTIVNERHESLADFKAAIERHAASRDVDYMDGFIYSPTEYGLSVGKLAAKARHVHGYDWTRVYYKAVRRGGEDALRTPDYFFRYDHGVTGVHPKSFAGRLLFAKLLGSSRLLKLGEKLHFLLKRERPNIVLDVFLPFSKLEAFLEWYADAFGFFPLWVVPYRRVRNYEWLTERIFETQDELFVDLAIYGMKQRGGTNYYRLMEEKLLELGGLKTLISHNYYSPEEFWRTWNKPNYDAVKAITDPHNIFRDLYSKTCRAMRGLKDAEEAGAATVRPGPQARATSSPSRP